MTLLQTPNLKQDSWKIKVSLMLACECCILSLSVWHIGWLKYILSSVHYYCSKYTFDSFQLVRFFQSCCIRSWSFDRNSPRDIMSTAVSLPSEIDLKQKLRDNMEFLKKNTLRLKMLVSELVSCDLLTFDQADDIMQQPNHISMHEKMYTFLMEAPQMDSSQFPKLLKALKSSGNGHLVDVLQK